MNKIVDKLGYICDMDGVIYHGNTLLPGVKEFVDWLYANGKKFLFLTNNSGKTPLELKQKLMRIPEFMQWLQSRGRFLNDVD